MKTAPVLPVIVRTPRHEVVSLLPYDTPMQDIRIGLSGASGPWEIHAVDLWDEEGEW